jgi:alpha-methylacyl-CoA racemase
MRAAIAAAVRRRSRDDWCTRLEGSDACFAPVLTFAEAAQHSHAQARDAFVEVDGLRQPAPAPRFSRTPAGSPQAAPRQGQHSAAVLGEAGYSAAEIEALITRGIAR